MADNYFSKMITHQGGRDSTESAAEIHPTLTRGMQLMGQLHRRSRYGAAVDLLVLARGGNTSDLTNLAQEIDINKLRDSAGYTALHLAAIGDHGETIDCLLNLGAEIESITPEGQTALHLAAERGSGKALKILLQRGANVNVQDSTYKDTPLHKSSWGGYKDCILMLMKSGANHQIRDDDGCVPLELAKINRQHEAFALIENVIKGDKLGSMNYRRRRNPLLEVSRRRVTGGPQLPLESP